MLRVNAAGLDPDRIAQRDPVFLHLADWASGVGLLKRALAGLPYLGTGLRRLRRKADNALPVLPPLFSESEKLPAVPQRDAIGEEFSCDYLRPISGLARNALFSYTDDRIKTISEKKRSLYRRLTAQLAGISGISILWPDLPEGTVPFGVLLRVRSGRDRLYARLSRRFEVLTWPTLPGEVLKRLEEFPEVASLGRELLILNLPADRVVHPGFGTTAQKIVEEIRSFTSA
jgi:hypothetical protein